MIEGESEEGRSCAMGVEQMKSRAIGITGCDLLSRPGVHRTSVDVVLEKGRVSSIAAAGSKPLGPGIDTLDGRGMLAMPGLVNAHTHSPENCLRGAGEGMKLEPWLIRMFGTAGVFSAEDHYACAMAGAVEMLRLGVTSVVDHLWMTPPSIESAEGAIRAYREVGIRAGIAPLVNDLDFTGRFATGRGFELGDAEMSRQVDLPPASESIALLEELISRWHGSEGGRISILAGPGGVQWCSDQLLTGLAETSDRHRTGLHIHLLETRMQALTCADRFGRRGIGDLADLGVLGPSCSLPHSVWVDRSDIELIADHNAIVVHNPAANQRLGSGRAPVDEMLAAGVKIALGTDGSASSDNQNLWHAIKLAALIHNDGTSWVSGADALEMATTGGAGVLLRSDVGAIEEGAVADLILLDRNSDGLAGSQDLEASLALSESGGGVRDVIVDGRLVVRDGRCITVDQDAVRARLREQAEKRRAGVKCPSLRTRDAMDLITSFDESLQLSAMPATSKQGGGHVEK